MRADIFTGEGVTVRRRRSEWQRDAPQEADALKMYCLPCAASAISIYAYSQRDYFEVKDTHDHLDGVVPVDVVHEDLPTLR